MDLPPATAQQIGITRRQGLSTVVVAPLVVPQPDGSVKLGAAAKEIARAPVMRAHQSPWPLRTVVPMRQAREQPAQ